MMNWNSNDTKYIIKRIILYFIIAGIVFFAGQSCAKAMTVSSEFWDPNGNLSTINIIDGSTGGAWVPANAPFKNMGAGYINFNILYASNSSPAQFPYDIRVQSGNNVFECDIGNIQVYMDNITMRNIMTVKCPVFAGQYGINQLFFIRNGTTGYLVIQPSNLVTFTTDSEVSSSIMNNTNTIIQQQITNDNTNAQAIQNTITNATQQQVTAINNQTTAINNQTQAINDINDWFQQDHDPLIDTGFLDVFDDLWTTQDDDIVRQFIMIPFNLLVLIYNSISQTSCRNVQLGALYNVTLELPCINLQSLIGSALYNTIDIIFAGGLLFGFIRFVKHLFNKLFTISGTITDECGVEVFN